MADPCPFHVGCTVPCPIETELLADLRPNRRTSSREIRPPRQTKSTRILQWARAQSRPWTIAEVADGAGLSREEVKDHLHYMLKTGRFRRVGKRPKPAGQKGPPMVSLYEAAPEAPRGSLLRDRVLAWALSQSEPWGRSDVPADALGCSAKTVSSAIEVLEAMGAIHAAGVGPIPGQPRRTRKLYAATRAEVAS